MDCTHCQGSGMIKTPESMAIEVVRLLILAAQRSEVAEVTVTVADPVAKYLNNKKRRELARLEDEGAMAVQIVDSQGVSPEHLVVQCRDAEGREVEFSHA